MADKFCLHPQRHDILPYHLALLGSHFPQVLIGLHCEPVFGGGAEEAHDTLRHLRL